MDPTGLPAMRLALGLAALGRPGYITLDHDVALGADRSVAGMRQRAFEVMDAAYGAGVRHVDAARSYGLAEDFLASWLAARPMATDVLVSSKWGYRYVGDWQVDVDVHEVKDHSVAAFRRQWSETQGLLGERVGLYQVHSLTPESPALGDRTLLHELGALRDTGVGVGISTSGPSQSEVILEALAVTIGGGPLFSSVQATWNLLEPSVEEALTAAAVAGWQVIVKEALANGRLAGPGAPEPLVSMAREHGTTPDAAAIAATLALECQPTVLLGPVSVHQLTSNLAALDVAGTAVTKLMGLAEPAEEYWRYRSSLPWH